MINLRGFHQVGPSEYPFWSSDDSFWYKTIFRQNNIIEKEYTASDIPNATRFIYAPECYFDLKDQEIDFMLTSFLDFQRYQPPSFFKALKSTQGKGLLAFHLYLQLSEAYERHLDAAGQSFLKRIKYLIDNVVLFSSLFLIGFLIKMMGDSIRHSMKMIVVLFASLALPLTYWKRDAHPNIHESLLNFIQNSLKTAGSNFLQDIVAVVACPLLIIIGIFCESVILALNCRNAIRNIRQNRESLEENQLPLIEASILSPQDILIEASDLSPHDIQELKSYVPYSFIDNKGHVQVYFGDTPTLISNTQLFHSKYSRQFIQYLSIKTEIITLQRASGRREAPSKPSDWLVEVEEAELDQIRSDQIRSHGVYQFRDQ